MKVLEKCVRYILAVNLNLHFKIHIYCAKEIVTFHSSQILSKWLKNSRITEEETPQNMI